MFRDTIALKTNPFGPSFPATQENRARLSYITDLDRLPLRLDQCDDLLRPLFCDSILDFRSHKARFHDLMTERGYVFGERAQHSMDSALVVIRGAIGSGKTTLGAWMIAEMAQLPCVSWSCFHVPDPPEGADPTRVAAFNLLRGQIAAVPMGNHVAVLVENVSAASLSTAIACYNELGNWPRLFVVTTSNLKLLDTDEWVQTSAARIEVFTLGQFTAADADAYVAHRLPQYRDPERPEIDAVSPIFPFPPGLPGRFVQRGEDAGAPPVVLRQLNTHFRRKLAGHASHLRSRPGHVSVETAPATSLPEYLIPEI